MQDSPKVTVRMQKGLIDSLGQDLKAVKICLQKYTTKVFMMNSSWSFGKDYNNIASSVRPSVCLSRSLIAREGTNKKWDTLNRATTMCHCGNTVPPQTDSTLSPRPSEPVFFWCFSYFCFRFFFFSPLFHKVQTLRVVWAALRFTLGLLVTSLCSNGIHIT